VTETPGSFLFVIGDWTSGLPSVRDSWLNFRVIFFVRDSWLSFRVTFRDWLRVLFLFVIGDWNSGLPLVRDSWINFPGDFFRPWFVTDIPGYFSRPISGLLFFSFSKSVLNQPWLVIELPGCFLRPISGLLFFSFQKFVLNFRFKKHRVPLIFSQLVTEFWSTSRPGPVTPLPGYSLSVTRDSIVRVILFSRPNSGLPFRFEQLYQGL